MQQSDVLMQASSNAPAGEYVIHHSVSPIGPEAWIEALSVARRIAREGKVDVYRAEAGSSPTLFESCR
jgi:hypothetical protein